MEDDHHLPATLQHAERVFDAARRHVGRDILKLTCGCVPYFLVCSCHKDSIALVRAYSRIHYGEPPMNCDLPAILDRYFNAQNAHDIEAMVACFAPDAAVRDERRDIIGTEAVRAWKKETSAKYRITAQPLECRQQDGRTTVVVKVSGAFNGSPAKLTYGFGFSGGGLIDALEVC